MASVIPKTVGESLYWSYASLAMAFTGDRHQEPTYQQIDYIVRNKYITACCEERCNSGLSSSTRRRRLQLRMHAAIAAVKRI